MTIIIHSFFVRFYSTLIQISPKSQKLPLSFNWSTILKLTMAEIDLQEIKAFLVELAEEAGVLIKSKTGQVSYEDKANGKSMICSFTLEKFTKTKLDKRWIW